MERRDGRHRLGVRARRAVAAVVAGATVALGVTMVPARAAQAGLRVGAPYRSASKETTTSCGHATVAPSCAASATADAANGRMDASAAIDSGANGNLPGTAASTASGFVTHTVDMGRATAATFVFHVGVLRADRSTSHLGKAATLLSAGAVCDDCVVPSESYEVIDRAGDAVVSVTLVRGPSGGHLATVTLGTHATASDYCDDFCIGTARGVARANAQTVLRGIDVQLVGLGRPAVPAFEAPAAGETVAQDHYMVCDAECRTVDGREASGGAEPGMPVQILDGNRVVATAQADADGQWSAVMPLSTGNHVLMARAVGPDGVAATARRTVHVTG